MDKLAAATKEDELSRINEIGEKMADSIVAFFEKEEAHRADERINVSWSEYGI